ncbi:MAG: sterol desaturase family protein [Flavisolibacter sp.]
MKQLPDLLQLFWFLMATIIIFLIVLARYLLVAGLFYGIFYLWHPIRWNQRKISSRNYAVGQFKTEVKWSTITTFIFAVFGAATVALWQHGWIKVYANAHDYPLWWMPSSLFIALLLHETYYYWIHRWMHHPAIFKRVHKVHHDSHITSPWTAFSFHPLEGILQALFLPLLLLVLPMHLYILIIQLTFMTLSSVVNHLNIEIYPEKFHHHPLGKWLIGATHHSLHHKQYKYNFGLYFTFWDRWKKTESPFFEKLFEEKTKRSTDNA